MFILCVIGQVLDLELLQQVLQVGGERGELFALLETLLGAFGGGMG